MDFAALKKILVKENINPIEYDILEKGYVTGFDGYIIESIESGYGLYYMERGQKNLIAEFSGEKEVCLAFLKELAKTGDPQLAKYIQWL